MSNVVTSAVSTSVDLETKKQINELKSLTMELNRSVNAINNGLNSVAGSVNTLRHEFEQFRMEQGKSQAINRATTELVRVRQELEQKFSNYAVVRETMLGVLQATDLALVKKDTISRVSEELMLSTPEYWLAPCLVAVAAWIGNDKDLAERAIREAVKRDEAKTALTMALICRRNERQQTCYEWLAIYFSHQDSANFSESTLAYIDAYVNGIFGHDDKHICDDYINKWMNEVKGNSSNIEADQEQIWKEYCSRFSYDISDQFPDLKDSIVEYDNVDSYIRRINSVDSIVEKFSGIRGTEVNKETLKESIDKRLLDLIGKYDSREEGMKDEERYYDLVKRLDGDTEKARQIMIREKQAREEETLNLVEQMTNVIVTNEDVMPSMRKTAVSFLSGYIDKGFNSYITEKKAAFPDTVTTKVDNWTGKIQSGDEAASLCAEFERSMTTERQNAIIKATNNKPKIFYGLGIVAAVIGLITLFAVTPILGILFFGGAGAAAFYGFNSQKEMDKNLKQINDDYARRISEGKTKIQRVCTQWKAAKGVVTDFENNPTETIIA